jgi:ankyrin repeat protein
MHILWIPKLVTSALQDSRTSVHFASANGHLDVVRYLIEKCGADVNMKDDVSEFNLID